MDLGRPASYLTLEAGTPVYSADGEQVGTVAHVLRAEEEDIFDGLVIDIRAGPGGHRFADAPQVAEIRERGVLLGLDAATCERLPEPSENPAVVEASPDDVAGEGPGDALRGKLRRAWDLISGNY
jgi:hypothetical protein